MSEPPDRHPLGGKDPGSSREPDRGDVSLADLYKVFHALRPDAAAGREIFRLLRLEHLREVTGRAVPGGYDPSQAADRERRQARELDPPPIAEPAPAPPPEPPTPPEGPPLAAGLTELGTTATERPEWLDSSSLVPLAPPRKAPKPPPPPPLLSPLRERAILVAGLSTRAEKGPIDLRRLIARVARRQSLRKLPRRPEPTLSRGVRLYLDHSAAMQPYANDRRPLWTAIENVVGEDRTEVFFFVGSPLRGVDSLRRRRAEPWQPPPRGTVVALVTDLGIGGPPTHPDRATEAEWLEFARKVRDAGCPLVAFVPFQPLRWPRQLARRMTLIHWDRPTTARAVAQVVGPGHEVTL